MIQLRRPDPDSTDFAAGELVRHKRYGYRGVVVDADPSCEADEDWYRSNQSQPTRSQPWYHVLVHGSTHSTYAAHENLERDQSSEPVHHPLVANFFHAFVGGRYLRNDHPFAL